MKANPLRAVNLVKIESRDSLFYIATQFFPIVGLRGDSLSQAIRREASLDILINLKDKFTHA
jgi:hypothetical protein